jgi:hypothetical protein
MRSITAHKKPRGRPRTGHEPSVSVRLNQEIIDSLNAMAKARKLRRSDLLRQLIVYGLNVFERDG